MGKKKREKTNLHVWNSYKKMWKLNKTTCKTFPTHFPAHILMNSVLHTRRVFSLQAAAVYWRHQRPRRHLLHVYCSICQFGPMLRTLYIVCWGLSNITLTHVDLTRCWCNFLIFVLAAVCVSLVIDDEVERRAFCLRCSVLPVHCTTWGCPTRRRANFHAFGLVCVQHWEANSEIAW